eukprot:g4156.t1
MMVQDTQATSIRHANRLALGNHSSNETTPQLRSQQRNNILRRTSHNRNLTPTVNECEPANVTSKGKPALRRSDNSSTLHFNPSNTSANKFERCSSAEVIQMLKQQSSAATIVNSDKLHYHQHAEDVDDDLSNSTLEDHQRESFAKSLGKKNSTSNLKLINYSNVNPTLPPHPTLKKTSSASGFTLPRSSSSNTLPRCSSNSLMLPRCSSNTSINLHIYDPSTLTDQAFTDAINALPDFVNTTCHGTLKSPHTPLTTFGLISMNSGEIMSDTVVSHHHNANDETMMTDREKIETDREKLTTGFENDDAFITTTPRGFREASSSRSLLSPSVSISRHLATSGGYTPQSQSLQSRSSKSQSHSEAESHSESQTRSNPYKGMRIEIPKLPTTMTSAENSPMDITTSTVKKPTRRSKRKSKPSSRKRASSSQSVDDIEPHSKRSTKRAKIDRQKHKEDAIEKRTYTKATEKVPFANSARLQNLINALKEKRTLDGNGKFTKKLASDMRREIKLLRNKEAAQRSRNRHRVFVDTLKGEIAELEESLEMEKKANNAMEELLLGIIIQSTKMDLRKVITLAKGMKCENNSE